MANQADKKREKSNASFTNVISYIFIFVILWFFIVKYLFKRGIPVSTGAWVGYTVQLLVQTLCFKWISKSLEILAAVIYIIGQMIVNWVFTPTAEELQDEISDPKKDKKQRKAELKQRRQIYRQ